MRGDRPGPSDQGITPRRSEAAAGERGGISDVLLTTATGTTLAARRCSSAERIHLGDGAGYAGLTAIATPGHASDHLCFLAGDVCFSGDLVLGQGFSIVPPDAGR